jgi:hypothetical protein
MPVKAILDYLCERLEQVVNAPVIIHSDAGAGQDGLLLLPYQFFIDDKLRNITDITRKGGRFSTVYCIRLLLIQNHWQTDYLNQAIVNLRDNPVATVNNARLQIVTETLSLAELTAIFQSAQLPLALSAAWQLRYEVAT